MPIYTPGRRRTILILLLSSVLLVTIDLRGNTLLDGARSGFDYVFRPFQIAGEVVTRPVVRAWDGITQVDDLQRKNRELQEQWDEARGDILAAINARRQNEEMRTLLDLPSLAEYDRRTCNTIGESPSNDRQTVEIACGSLDGLRQGMPVMNAAGLVGRITILRPETAVVMLLTDPSYHIYVKVVGTRDAADEVPLATTPSGLPVDDIDDIANDMMTTTTTSTSTTSTTLPPDPFGEPAQPGPDSVPGDNLAGGSVPGDSVPGDGVAPEGGTTTSSSTTSTTLAPVTRETGMLDGQGQGRLPRVSLISDSPQFGRPQVGDVVFTAGGGQSLAPPDLPIGYVVNVIPRPGTAGLLLEVEPNADLGRLDFLTVVLFQAPNEAPGVQ
ncbi:MAG TPA: rod shape-determining protein MreC [Ilumatobacter sp.]|nr:rod shape-determining protein MreC [Ilumatobacter sp.]